MAADSLPRRIAKRTLAPVLNETAYEVLQALAMAYDIWSGGLSEPELELIEYAVREGETALDIGANYGLYSYYLSQGRWQRWACVCVRTYPLYGPRFQEDLAPAAIQERAVNPDGLRRPKR